MALRRGSGMVAGWDGEGKLAVHRGCRGHYFFCVLVLDGGLARGIMSWGR